MIAIWETAKQAELLAIKWRLILPMKKILCLLALAALCGCATQKQLGLNEYPQMLSGAQDTGPNDPLTGNDWNYGPRNWTWGTENDPKNPNYEHADYVPKL